MTFGSFLIDFILLVIIGIWVFWGVKRGFVKTVVGTVGFFLSVILSLTLCTPLANLTYDTLIEPAILSTVNETVDAEFQDEFDKVADDKIDSEEIEKFKNEIDASSDDIIASLPAFVKNFINQSGIEVNELLDNADEIINEGDTVKTASEKLAVNVSQTKIKPIAANIIGAVYSLILFIIFSLIFKLLGKILNKFFSFSIVGKLNASLGGVCGFVKGTVFTIILCIVINAVVSFIEGGIWIFNYENFENTLLFNLFTSLI